MSRTEISILNFIDTEPNCSSAQIAVKFNGSKSLATIKRILKEVVVNGDVIKTGAGKNTRYKISNQYKLLNSVNLHQYFEKDIDERKIQTNFNFNLISETLNDIKLFNKTEIEELDNQHQKFLKKISIFTTKERLNEMERLAIDLSWKSSQIEGNTYSLLETEQLLKEKKTAAGKTKDEATMLLNHKDAIDFIVSQPDYMYPLSTAKIEDLHSMLVKELGVSKNIRTKRVSISGTNYLPIDNECQIKEAITQMCDLVNNKENIFEIALLTLILISYIQPFMDGNKRTARIVSNAVLLHFNYCPLSFRTVDTLDYKKAMVLFYEVNNITAFKKIFIEQYQFAVDTYF